MVWLLIVPIAIANGAFRTFVLVPALGDTLAHIISTLMLCFLIFLIACVALSPASRSQAWRIGLLWLALTIQFEFVAGHWLFGQPWERLLADYDVTKGRVWVLVLIATVTAPVLAHRLRV
jgi:hypothetical protein